MKKIFCLVSLVCCIILSCGNKDVNERLDDKSKTKDDSFIRVAFLPTIDALPFFIAEERGLFEKENINIKLIPFKAQMDVDTALIGGSIDMAFTDLIRSERLKREKGVKLEYLTSTELYWILVSNKTARINRLEQFGDKMVAMTRWSATDYLTNKTFDNVKTKDMVYSVQINDVDLRTNMILNNEMDGAWLPEPQAARAVQAGNKEVLNSMKYNEKLGVLSLRTNMKKKFGGDDTFEKLNKIYSAACDSINKNGIKAYAPELMKYCHVSSEVVAMIPKHVYIHAERPNDNIIKLAKGFQRR